MNQFIKLICLSIVAIAAAHAMENDADLGKQLLAAARLGNHNELERLIAAGAPVDYASTSGATALLLAALGSHLNCLRILIARGAPVNHQNKFGTSALAYAVMQNSLPCIKALIVAGARVNQATPSIWTALTYAIDHGNNQEACELLVERMLWIPNQEQKARMATFLGIVKFRKSLCLPGLDANLRNELKGPCPAVVYDNNKNNFESSIAYQELNNIKDLLQMQNPSCQEQIANLIEKYNTGTTFLNSQPEI